MIIGVGVDSIEIDRVRQAAERIEFRQRIYTPLELSQLSATRESPRLATLFAAKEAVFKALGTGLRGHSWQQVEVVHQANGRPLVQLHGQARITARRLGARHVHLSLTHDHTRAIAFCILEGGIPV
ncbi:MAG: holo-[acyl-carrier-protein] synthase [Firmicutes bacterium]|nr:holo-[acyl-carrier-protein] synthase [Bacillota bacterium]